MQGDKPVTRPHIQLMKPIALIAALVLSGTALAPATSLAQESPPEDPLQPFLELFTDRSQELLRDLMQDLGPEMDRLMAEIMPRLQELTETLGGLTAYELPEVLPNGDIIIRRRPDAPDLPDDFVEQHQNNPIDL